MKHTENHIRMKIVDLIRLCDISRSRQIKSIFGITDKTFIEYE